MTPGPRATGAPRCAEAPATHKGGRGLTQIQKQPGGRQPCRTEPKEAETTMENQTPVGGGRCCADRTDSLPCLAIGA